ncbi:zinc finger matrin-type protein CG9776 [Helicoverpa armigera]|uniref:zinc finger matrin-type protein CG9776 n=1 Tax=Helicoverpa armigera TaxID=29058 RepID=UPI0030829CFD
MSRDHRKDNRSFYNRDRAREWDRERDRERERERERDRDRDRERPNRDHHDYRARPMRKRSRTPPRRDDVDKRRSRSPRKNDKDLLDENILSEISKLPEPSELWDNQFQQETFAAAPPPPSFAPTEPALASTSYPSSYQPSYSGIYDDFPSVGGVPPAPLPPDMAAWNQMSLPPPPTATPAPFLNNIEDQIKKEAAIESEMRHQKAALSKQREDYIKKSNILKKEMETLKDQRNELRGDAKRSPSPDTKRFLKENTKLQLEIQNKLKTIYNVVDMLNGIIGEEAPDIPDDDADSAERKRKSRSPSNKKFNYVYYDPEMHWCRVCNEFPPTAKDYLNHLHSPAHHKMAAAHMEAPWHTVAGVNEGFPSFPAAPTKRTPIKGLQFFVPSTAWYCKLCDQFIGDLHCASAHLKSVVHSKNYTNFVEQNPHWETDWMSDRQKAFEKFRATKGKTSDEKPAQYTAHTITFNKDGFHTKQRKDSPPPVVEDKKKKKDKKKKSKRKSSSSSSSDSSSSDSEPKKKKLTKTKKSKIKVEPRDDKSLTEWMSNIQMDKLNDNDRKLLDTLKSRIKKEKGDEDKRRSPDHGERERSIADVSRKLRESERRTRDERERSRDRRDTSRERRDDSRRRDTPPRQDAKKPDIRKMPFIGKMPVYKHLGKTSKTEEQKKEEQKKKEEEEVTKKRREEMDAEIQKKVAEFKEKIARAQLERQQQVDIGPPALALPTQLAAPPPLAYMPPPAPAPPPLMPPQTPQPPQPTLPKDFQEALDIIFPTDVKPDLSQGDGLFPLPPGFVPGLGGVMPPFPPLPLMQTQMTQMFGFDLNASLFQPRTQLYDTHVPLVPSPKPRQQHNKNRHKQQQQQQQHQKKQNQNQNQNQNPPPKAPTPVTREEENGNVAKKKEEMDDLAMLGIDASDVGCI